jgi:hypothetical protein
MRIPVEGHPNLYRDSETNAIINCDKNEYDSYVNMVNNREKEKLEIKQIKDEMGEIKTLLYKLLEKNGS